MDEAPQSAEDQDDRRDLRSEADVEDLVRSFYREAAVDDLLGPVFAAAEVDWATHIPHVTQFWSWQLLGGRRYDGRPLRAHERVNALVPFTEAHYERWLELFTGTLRDRWSGPVAELAEHRAQLMARSMRRVLSGVEDPEPSWPEEVPPEPARSRGLVMPVALGRRPEAPQPGPPAERTAGTHRSRPVGSPGRGEARPGPTTTTNGEFDGRGAVRRHRRDQRTGVRRVR